MAKEVLMIVDGNNLVHRAYHAVPPLSLKSNGMQVNAAFGFTSMLLHAFAANKPNYCAIAFDLHGPTFRHEMDSEYKANRSETPDDLVPQFDMVKEIVRAFHIPIYERQGFEADDILGTLSVQGEQRGLTTLILSGDADALQLVTKNVFVVAPRPGKSFADTKTYDEDGVIEKFGVSPAYVADYKALVGDTSDNYKGVPGIGPKSAAKLIQQFGSIESIYARLNEVAPVRVKTLLQENEDSAYHSKTLATIVTNVPIELDLDEMSMSSYSRADAVDILKKYEFATLLNRLPRSVADERSGETVKPASVGIPAATKPQINVMTVEDLKKMVEDCMKGPYAVEPVIQGTDPMNCHLVGIAFSSNDNAYYLPLGHMCFDAMNQIPFDDVKGPIQTLFSCKQVMCSYNSNFLMTSLGDKGFTFGENAFDVMLGAHLLGDNSNDLQPLIFNRLGIELPTYADVAKKNKTSVAALEIASIAPVASVNATCILSLYSIMTDELRRQGMWSLYDKVEMPLVPILVEMQETGVAVDPDAMKAMSQDFRQDIGKLTSEIYQKAGHEFNINSPKQLGEVLFDEMKINIGKQKRSTDADMLESIKDENPIVPLILEYRSLFKLDSTYVSALPEMINGRTGRIHTTFNQARTSTGRLSSSNPNLQNIPVRSQLGNEIRKCFVASPKCVLISGDYSQIDLRSLAHLSQDEALMKVFREGQDIHTATAANIYGVKPEEVTKSMRSAAKAINFGVIYGMSSYGLEQQTALTRSEASEFIKQYFERFPGVKTYLDNVKAQARERGYVESLLGRRRSIPDIYSENRNIRERAEREAINMPVQGTSADIIKMAMLKLDKTMKKQYLKSRLILQVHDELIFEVPEPEQWVMQRLIKQEMETALELSIPLLVEIKQGKNWGSLQ